MKSSCRAITTAVSLLVIGIGPVYAGGECAPKLREVEAKIEAMPNMTSKEQVRELYEAAKKAAENYDDEGCLEHATRALERIKAAKS